MMFLYAGIEAAGQVHWGGSWPSYLGNIHLPYLPVPSVLVCMGLSCLVVGFVIYRLSHRTCDIWRALQVGVRHAPLEARFGRCRDYCERDLQGSKHPAQANHREE